MKKKLPKTTSKTIRASSNEVEKLIEGPFKVTHIFKRITHKAIEQCKEESPLIERLHGWKVRISLGSGFLGDTSYVDYNIDFVSPEESKTTIAASSSMDTNDWKFPKKEYKLKI